MKNKRGNLGSVLIILIILIVICYFIFPSTFESGYKGVQDIFKNLNINLPNIPAYVPNCQNNCGNSGNQPIAPDNITQTNVTISPIQNTTNYNPPNTLNYPDLNSYLNANLNVKTYVNNLDAQTKNDISMEYSLIKIGNGDNSKTKAERIAISIWIDNNNLVPWKLNDYSQTDLGYIFDESANNLIPDCDPLYTYNYAKSYIKTNKLDTINAILESLRRYTHSMGTSGGTGCLKDILAINNIMGCHAASQMMSDLISSLNIPAYYHYNSVSENWFVAGHGGLVVPNIGVLPDGDNLYSYCGVPTDKLLMPWSYFESNVIPLQSQPTYTFGAGCNQGFHNYYTSVGSVCSC